MDEWPVRPGYPSGRWRGYHPGMIRKKDSNKSKSSDAPVPEVQDPAATPADQQVPGTDRAPAPLMDPSIMAVDDQATRPAMDRPVIDDRPAEAATPPPAAARDEPVVDLTEPTVNGPGTPTGEIGRASCRERA